MAGISGGQYQSGNIYLFSRLLGGTRKRLGLGLNTAFFFYIKVRTVQVNATALSAMRHFARDKSFFSSAVRLVGRVAKHVTTFSGCSRQRTLSKPSLSLSFCARETSAFSSFTSSTTLRMSPSTWLQYATVSGWSLNAHTAETHACAACAMHAPTLNCWSFATDFCMTAYCTMGSWLVASSVCGGERGCGCTGGSSDTCDTTDSSTSSSSCADDIGERIE